MNALRIVHLITRSEPGGAQSMVRSLAESQCAAGHSVCIAAGPEGDGAAFEGMSDSVMLYTLPHLRRAISPLHDMRALIEITKLYKNNKFDIVHVHTSKAAALGRLASGITPSRIIYTMHGYDQLRIQNKKMLFIDKALRARCGAVVAVSAFDAAAMRADGYAPLLIYNGVHDNGVHANAAHAPRELTASSGSTAAKLDALKAAGLPLVMMIARDARPKRIDVAREAASLLRGLVRLAWIGGYPSSKDPENFFALGSEPDAARFLRYADIFLLSSDNEGLSVSLLEAMAAGLPLVASAVGGIPELFRHGDIGFMTENNAEAMASYLRLLASDAAMRLRMGSAARAVWAEHFSARMMAQEYESLYYKTCISE